MNRRMFRWMTGLFLVLVVACLSAGCAQDLPDIDRTQPNAIDKSIFRKTNEDGSLREWYFRQTVIEVPYGTGSTFVGEQGKTEKVVWDITENFLYAYRSREYVEGTDGTSRRPGATDQAGAAIAAFRITKHFDVQRNYNPATGEQTNVIVENASDRPWNERKYFRVDFSQNLISDFSFVASNVAQQPVGYAIPEDEKNNKDRAKLTDNYVDIVQKMFVQPEINELYSKYYGRPVPSCWLYTDITKDCLGQTIKIRSSFMLAKQSKYNMKEYDNNRMTKFGYFRSINYKYDRSNGVIEDTVSRVINRWNIWKDESTCAEPGQKLSHAKCEVKKIPYHINEQFPAELKSATAEVFKQWNQQFAAVVKARSGKDQANVFVFCPNNPVKEGDDATCGKAGTNPQIGDLRYNFIYWVVGPHRYSPLGYGPSAADPITGEIFNANSFIYGGALDRYASYATDLVKMLNGDLKGEDLANAKQLQTYFQNLGKVNEHSLHHHHTMSLQKGKLTKELTQLKEIGRRLRERVRNGKQQFDWVAANLQTLANNPNNAALLSGEPFKAFNLGQLAPSGQVNQKILDLFGPHKLVSREFFTWQTDRMSKLSGRNVYMADFMDDGLLARALKMKKEFSSGGKVDYSKVSAKIREDIYLGVTLHEVGHNLGLRHNFAGSADALNYHDQYWKLRGETQVNGKLLPFYRYTGDKSNTLRAAIEKGMHEYQYSSIMDYGANPASDLQGLGKYDRAAILYGYGDIVEVFKKGSTVLTSSNVQETLATRKFHYTQLPQLVAGSKSYSEQIKSFTAASRTLATLDELKKDKSLIEVPFKFCSDEYHHGSTECNRFDQGADPYERVFDMSQRYWGYYILNAFKRGRVEFGLNTSAYLSRIYSRYFLPITHQYKHFVNDALIIRSGETCPIDGAGWYSSDACGQAGFIASTLGLNFFSRVLQTPDAGCYTKNITDGQILYSHTSEGDCVRENGKLKSDQLEVPLGIGRKMLSGFDKESNGYEFYWKPNNYGAWWDKYLAVMAMGDPYTRFLGVDRSGNTRSYLINYTTLYGRYVGNLVGGFLASKPVQYGPKVTGDKEITFRNEITVADNGFVPVVDYPLAPTIDPNEQYMAKLFIGFVAAVYFSGQTDDQDLNEAMKISVRGLSESPDVPEAIRNDPTRYVEVIDPGSNRIYYAAKTQTTDPTFNVAPNAFSTGYEMLMKIKQKYFKEDGRTLKDPSQATRAHSEFHYIRVLMGWLRAGEYNRPR